MAPVVSLAAYSVAAALALGASAINTAAGTVRDRKAGGFVRGLEFRHRLRICNAYPYAATMDVIHGRHQRLTADSPMPYKTCRDFASPLQEGDKLDFKIGDANAGTFSVSNLPSNDALLLLVIHLHDMVSTAVSFESHVFASLQNAQIAIIDTYRGLAKSVPRILDAVAPEDDVEVKRVTANRSEELRYDSVVAVNPGVYKIDLADAKGAVKSSGQLVALGRESYVVLRTGVESQSGQSFPEELVIFPVSPSHSLHGGSRAGAVPMPLLCLLILLARTLLAVEP